jgi:hypothetical protein
VERERHTHAELEQERERERKGEGGELPPSFPSLTSNVNDLNPGKQARGSKEEREC